MHYYFFLCLINNPFRSLAKDIIHEHENNSNFNDSNPNIVLVSFRFIYSVFQQAKIPYIIPRAKFSSNSNTLSPESTYPKINFNKAYGEDNFNETNSSKSSSKNTINRANNDGTAQFDSSNIGHQNNYSHIQDEIANKLKADDENEKELINREKIALESSLSSNNDEVADFEKSIGNKFRNNIQKNLHASNDDSFVKDIIKNEHKLANKLHNFQHKIDVENKNEEKENEEKLKEEEMMNSFSNIPSTQSKPQEFHSINHQDHSDHDTHCDHCVNNTPNLATESNSKINPYKDPGCPTKEVFDKLNSVKLETKPTLHLRYEKSANGNAMNENNHSKKSFLEVTSEQAEVLDKYAKDLNDRLKQDQKVKDK